MARRRAAVINHAPGLSGIPWAGQFSSAATRLSWTASSAMSKLPMRRTIAPVSLAASSRNTAVSAASVTFLVSVRPSSFHSRPDLDRAGAPCLGHLERLVEILHLHDGESADDLFRLDERAVGDDGLAVLKTNRGSGLRSLQLFAADDLAGALVDRSRKLIRRDGTVDPADGLGLLGGKPRRLDQVARRAGFADEPGQPLCSTGAGDDPQRSLRLADAGPPVLDHDPEVAA